MNKVLIKKRRVTFMCSLLTVAMVSGCATASKDISATYISPVQFESYNCQQIAAEQQRLQMRYTELGGRLDQAASNDKAIAGVGIILFWPALFALGGNKQQEAEYARLKGEYDAVQQASVRKGCGIGGSPAAAPAPVPATSATATTPVAAR